MSDRVAPRSRRAAPTARAKAPTTGARVEAVVAERIGAMRQGWPSLLAGAAACGTLIKLGFDAGGYFPADSIPAAAFCFLVLGVLVAFRQPRFALSTPAIVAFTALGGLALWTGLSSTWSLAPDSGFEDFQRTLLYVALFGLALYAAASGRYSRMLLWGALTVCAVVAGAGLLSRLLPGVVEGSVSQVGTYRLSYPLTYWNALGALAAMGALLALGLAANPRSLPWSRGVAATLAVALVVTMELTLSRASWLALILGVAALLVLGAHRVSLLLSGAVIGAAAALALLRLQSYHALLDDPALGAGQVSEGREFAVQLAILAGGAGVVVAMLAAGRRSVMVNDLVERARRPFTIAVAATVVVAACTIYATKSTTVEGRSARGLDAAQNWVSRQWDEFMTPSSFTATGSGRLTSASGTRSDLYRVAINGFEDNPLFGQGAGSFEVLWYRQRNVDEDVRDAHSLDLEVLSELGIVGALLLVAMIGAFATGIVRTRHKGGAVTRSEAAAAGAACCVWVVHSFVDWDWQMPAVSGVTLLVAAAVLPEGRRKPQTRYQRRSAIPRAQ
jgi:O-antigen ligase